MLDSFLIVAADVDNVRLGFLETAAAGAVEEDRPRTYHSAVDGISLGAAHDGKIRVFFGV
jgi:hypothetical protein